MSAYVDCAKIKTLDDTGVVTTAGKTGILYSVNIYGDDGTAIVTLKDGTASGTTKLIVASGTAGQSVGYTAVKGLIFNTDIHATKSGTATNVLITIEYDEIEK